MLKFKNEPLGITDGLLRLKVTQKHTNKLNHRMMALIGLCVNVTITPFNHENFQLYRIGFLLYKQASLNDR